MITSDVVLSLSSDELRIATRNLVARSQGVEAELLVHLGEIDDRKLYLEWAYSSMFAFCVEELGLSEDVAFNRISVARAARSMPTILEAVRSGRVHLAGLRVLAPHLTIENHVDVLAQAARKSKREIEELAARLAPKPPVPATIRKLPPAAAVAVGPAAQPAPTPGSSQPAAVAPPKGAAPPRDERRSVMAPLAAETFRIQFTATRQIRDNLLKAQDLLRHRVPDGDIPKIVGMALELLIEQVLKERFAVGRKARPVPDEQSHAARSRHIPNAIKRFVYERDGGRCTYVDANGKRCDETNALEFEHEEGFARTHEHDPDRIRLLCRAHNQYAAERMYGREFMERARSGKPVLLRSEGTKRGRPGAGELWITRGDSCAAKTEERLV